MNPYQFTAYCEVCGGEGAATGNTVVAMFYGGFVSHHDPQTCARIIRERQANLSKLEVAQPNQPRPA